MSNKVEKVSPSGGAALPDYLKNKAKVGSLEGTREYIVLQRVKWLQKSTGAELLSQHGVGAVLLAPSNQVIAPCVLNAKGNREQESVPFFFTPVFFWPSWGRVNDINLRGREPMMLHYTNDPADPIVIKSRTKELREEKHPSLTGMTIKNIEFLNFLIAIDDPRFKDLAVVCTFQKAEWMTGSNFLSKIKSTDAEIFARRWQASSGVRPPRNGFDWVGLNIVEPDEGPMWVTDEQYDEFEKAHLKAKDEHLKGVKAGAGFKPADLEEEATEPTEKVQY